MEAVTSFILAAVGRILNVDVFGPHENLFARGARSIDVARVAAAIHSEYGVQLNLTQVYQFPTPAGLASIVQDSAGDAANASGGSADPAQHAWSEARREVEVLLPFQHWYYDLVAPHAISFCLGVRVKHDFGSLDRLHAAMGKMVDRHLSLTASYVNDGRSSLVTAGVGQVIWEEFDVSSADDEGILIRAKSLAAAMDPASGAVVGVGHPAGSAEWFVLVVHHLAGDATSIDILVDEILTLLRDDDATLPVATTALDWAQTLNDYAFGPRGDAERQYWSNLPEARHNKLRADLSRATGEQVIDNDEIAWDHVESAARSVNLSPADLLICLLAQAYFNLTDDDQVTIGATKSGRDIAIDNATCGRAVGWVAVNVPHVLTAPSEAGPVGTQRLADQMHAVPSRGAGNQLWEYVDSSDLGDKIRAIRDSAEIIVNYMAAEPPPADNEVEWLSVQGDKSPLPRRKVLRLAVDRESPETIVLEWQYDPGLYASDQITSMRGRLISLLRALSTSAV